MTSTHKIKGWAEDWWMWLRGWTPMYGMCGEKIGYSKTISYSLNSQKK
jgi:hypothetical protein